MSDAKTAWLPVNRMTEIFERDKSTICRYAKSGQIETRKIPGQRALLYSVVDASQIFGKEVFIVEENTKKFTKKETTSKPVEPQKIVVTETPTHEIDVKKIKNILEVSDAEASRIETVLRTFSKNELSILEVFERALGKLKSNRREEEKYVDLESFQKDMHSYFVAFTDSVMKVFSKLQLHLDLSNADLAYMKKEYYKELRRIKETLKRDGYTN